MPDYSDRKEWKHVELWDSGREYLSEIKEYSLEDVTDILKRLLKVADSEGLEKVHFCFQSHNEPYETWLGNPSVTVCGYRKLTYEEKEDLKRQEELKSFAEEKGISFYEARIVKNLLKKGKI